jgi:hypothetical protein
MTTRWGLVAGFNCGAVASTGAPTSAAGGTLKRFAAMGFVDTNVDPATAVTAPGTLALAYVAGGT